MNGSLSVLYSLLCSWHLPMNVKILLPDSGTSTVHVLHPQIHFSFIALTDKTISHIVFLVASVLLRLLYSSCRCWSCLLIPFEGVIILKPYIWPGLRKPVLRIYTKYMYSFYRTYFLFCTCYTKYVRFITFLMEHCIYDNIFAITL